MISDCSDKGNAKQWREEQGWGDFLDRITCSVPKVGGGGAVVVVAIRWQQPFLERISEVDDVDVTVRSHPWDGCCPFQEESDGVSNDNDIIQNGGFWMGWDGGGLFNGANCLLVGGVSVARDIWELDLFYWFNKMHSVEFMLWSWSYLPPFGLWYVIPPHCNENIRFYQTLRVPKLDKNWMHYNKNKNNFATLWGHGQIVHEIYNIGSQIIIN